MRPPELTGPLDELFEGRLAAVADPALRAEWSEYLRYHRRRYELLLVAVREALAGRDAPRILNVGPMFETTLLRERVAGALVDTLGLAPHPLFPPRAGERHIDLDLNGAGDGSAPPGDGGYDAIVMAEVLEHLHSSPVLVLRYLSSWLRPGGALVLQTPNAVALHKRLRMLAGRNPLEPIPECAAKPGHFHEYTLGELREAAAAAGFTVEGARAANYFGTGGGARAYAALGRVLPPGMRHGLTLWARKPAAG